MTAHGIMRDATVSLHCVECDEGHGVCWARNSRGRLTVAGLGGHFRTNNGTGGLFKFLLLHLRRGCRTFRLEFENVGGIHDNKPR